MRFVEAVLLEPNKNVVALADAYFFPPFQPSLLPRTKGSAVIPSRLPPRRARLVVYNKQSNETSIWIVELSEVHAATRGGHHRGKVISAEVVPDVQPAMVSLQVRRTSACLFANHLVHVILCYDQLLFSLWYLFVIFQTFMLTQLAEELFFFFFWAFTLCSKF
jgi:hypothetical protein